MITRKRLLAALTDRPASVTLIRSRLGKDASREDVEKAVRKLVADGQAVSDRARVFFWTAP